MVASLHGFMLVLSIPLADASRKFEFFKLHSFPARIFNSTFVRYNPESNYFALSVLQRTHFTMTEHELLQCKGASFKVCPASRSVYSTQVETCALSLYLQRTSVRELCRRTVVKWPTLPVLERSGSVVMYHFPESRRVFIKCKYQQEWTTTHMVLQDTGVLKNVASSHVQLKESSFTHC
jgi:hypothetical protein